MVKIYKNLCYLLCEDAKYPFDADGSAPRFDYGFYVSTIDETSDTYYKITNQDGHLIQDGYVEPGKTFIQISGNSDEFISFPSTFNPPYLFSGNKEEVAQYGKVARCIFQIKDKSIELYLGCYIINWYYDGELDNMQSPISDLYASLELIQELTDVSSYQKIKPEQDMIYKYDTLWNYDDWYIIRGKKNLSGYKFDPILKVPIVYPPEYTGGIINNNDYYSIYYNAKNETLNGLESVYETNYAHYHKIDCLELELINPTDDGSYCVYPAKYIKKTNKNYTISLDKEYYPYGTTIATANINCDYNILLYRDNFNDYSKNLPIRNFLSLNTSSTNKNLDISKLPWEEISYYSPIIVFVNSSDHLFYANVSDNVDTINFNINDYDKNDIIINNKTYYRYKVGNFTFLVDDIQLQDNNNNVLGHCLDYYISGDSSLSYLYLNKNFIDSYKDCEKIILKYYKSVDTFNIQFEFSEEKLEYEYSDIDSINKYGIRDGGVFFIPVKSREAIETWCKNFINKNKYPKKAISYSSVDLVDLKDFPFLGRTINGEIISDCNITIDNNKIIKCDLKTGDRISTFIELFIKKIKDSE